jgi:hypothetical protein
MNDQLLVQNSKATQAILEATKAQAGQSLDMATQTRKLTEEMTKLLHEMQRETEASRQIATHSQRLAEEMMKDSVAMKTVSWRHYCSTIKVCVSILIPITQVALLTAFFLPGTSFAVRHNEKVFS